MIFVSTPQSSSSPPDDELAIPQSPYYRDHPNATSSVNRPAWTFPPPDSSTSANPRARRFPSPSTSGVAANTLSYPLNTSPYPVYNGYMESNISSNGGDFPSRSEEATTTQAMMADIGRLQNYYPTASADSMHYDSHDITTSTRYPATYELQPSSGYGNPVHNTQSWRAAQYNNTAHGGVDAGYSGTPVTGGNLPLMQYLDGYIPYRPQYASPNTDASSSSYHESPSYGREPPFYRESSALHPEAYHGLWPRREGPAICDPQVAGSSLPEQPDPSMAHLPSAATFSHPYIGRGDDTSNPSYRPPSIQAHQDLPRRNIRSRQNSRRRRGSHTHGTRPLPSTTFSCGWLVGENTTCGFEGPLDAFKTHFRHSHLSGAQDAPNVCYWQGCKYRKRDNAEVCSMRRDSTWRHVWETHLKMKRIP